MKRCFLLTLLFTFGFSFNYLFAKDELSGKELFYTLKGKYGSCNYCHKDGGSSGRWNYETNELSEEGKKIPSLKGISKRKTPEQIERGIKAMKVFGFKFTDEEVLHLSEYLGTL